MEDKRLVSLILRLGLAFVFIYVGIAAFLNPGNWIGFMPVFIGVTDTVLIVHNVLVIALGVWLVLGRKIFYASIVSALFLFGIIVFNMGAFDIVFRDMAILAMAIALAILSREK